MKKLLLAVSHLLFAAAGFAAGIYALPILTAPPAPSASEIGAAAGKAEFQGQFRRDLKGSDLLHWGEGTVSVSKTSIALTGRVAPGPDYKLYLSPEFVETKADFMRLKTKMVRVGDVKTFENFIVPVPGNIDPAAFNAVIVWCESFGQFIAAAKYK
jgi:Electron transfer DM13